MEEQETRQSIREEQEEFIRDFNAFGDWMMQYECLLELTCEMEPMTEEEKNPDTMISGCQAKLWVSMKYKDGHIHVTADSESLIVKGMTAVIVLLYDQRTPMEILNTEIDFIERTPIRKQISTDRFHGMQTVAERIRSFAEDCIQSETTL